MEPPTRRCAHLRGWRLRLTVLGPAAGSPGARHEEREPRPPGQHLASRVGVFRFRNPGSSQAPRSSPGNNRRSGPEFPAARLQAAPCVPPVPSASFPASRPRGQVSPHPALPRAAPRPGLPALQCLGPRCCRGSSLSSHPAPPSLRRAGAPGPASQSPSHLRPPTPSQRVAIFSRSSARRHRLCSQLAAARPPSQTTPQPRAAVAAAAAAAHPAHRVARTQPAPPRPPPSPPSPAQAPVAAGKSLLAEQRRSPSQLSVTPLLLPRHSLLCERWLWGEEGEVRGSLERGEGGRDSPGGSGRR